MALIKCYECSAEISDKASCCPNCGAPVMVHKHKCSKCGNMISEEPCPYCSNAQTDVNVNNVNLMENRTDLNDSDYNQQQQVVKKDNKSKIVWIVLILLAAVIIIAAFLITGHLSANKNEEIKTVDMGAVGNKITVDGTTAYVAGENKILVAYDFYGNFSECQSAAYGKSLKGCENPQLPTDETNDLPEEVVREIISFYGDIGGFWTSVEADHANMEFADTEPESLHYAGVMDSYFSVGDDDAAALVWGYCLKAYNDETTMGLLVLYDVIADDFEFTDVEDTADPNYSTVPSELYESVYEESDPYQDEAVSSYDDSYSEDKFNDNDSSSDIPLEAGKYTISHIFSPFSGWVKVSDSNGNYSDAWKSEEINNIKSFYEDSSPEFIEEEINAFEETFEAIQSNMYFDISDKWMKCYNIYNDFDLCKVIIDETTVYDNETDTSMGKHYTLQAEMYEVDEDGLPYYTYWGYDFLYYPDVNGIGVNMDNYKILFTL